MGDTGWCSVAEELLVKFRTDPPHALTASTSHYTVEQCGRMGLAPTQEYGRAPTSLWLSVCLAQFSLLSEVRGVISPQDLDRFDNLVLKREIESMKARQPSGPSIGTDSYSMISYSDTVSSSSSHFTATTVSSARVSPSWLFLLLSMPAPGSPTTSSLPWSAVKAFHPAGSPVQSASPMDSPKALYFSLQTGCNSMICRCSKVMLWHILDISVPLRPRRHYSLHGVWAWCSVSLCPQRGRRSGSLPGPPLCLHAQVSATCRCHTMPAAIHQLWLVLLNHLPKDAGCLLPIPVGTAAARPAASCPSPCPLSSI